MSELLDMLLSADCPNVAKNLPEKKIEVKTLSRRLGKKAVFTIRALPYGKVQELRRMDDRNTSLHIVLSGCVDPDWRAKELLDPAAGIATPLDAIESRLLAGEIADVAMEIEKLSGYRMNTIQEVKNG